MNSAAMNDDRSFWAEIKKIRNAKPAKCKTVDAVSYTHLTLPTIYSV